MFSAAAIVCLALNVYYEARGEPVEGQYAVAFVTLNRAKVSGKSLCEVVNEPQQFSWTMTPQTSPDGPQWLKALIIAKHASAMPDQTKGSLFFHRHDVFPKWRTSYKFTMQIGNHVFYSTIHPS